MSVRKEKPRKTGKGKTKGRKSRSRRIALRLGIVLLAVGALLSAAGNWFVHHPRGWLTEARDAWPAFVTKTLYWFGNPSADITDGLAITGHDAVYEYDTAAPEGSVLFAGAPVREKAPAPDDIRVIDRGEFLIGWSDRLRHPVWCAYHVTRDARFAADRKNFTRDKSLPRAANPGDYGHTGYDRGHMVPNHAIVTRYGEGAQRKTFLMSNISPQTPSLNRGVWRDVEHRIADLWTARYGEIWVIVGCISRPHGETLNGTDIDVPDRYYQLIVAQEGMDVRALAVVFPQYIPYDAYAARNIVSIDELEEMTGLDFLPELPSFIQSPLEADVPTRLWPVRPWDIFRQVALRFH